MHLKFYTQLNGTRGGQKDLTLYAIDDNTDKKIGRIDYSEYRDEPSIKMIFVEPEYWRKGVGTELAKELQREYPGEEIIWGSTTTAGAAFIKRLPKKWLENKKYTKLKKELDLVKAKTLQIERILEKWGQMFKTNERLAKAIRPKMSKYAEMLDDLERYIYKLENEISVEKPGKWIISR